jgi:hypothetical protein
LDSNSQVPPPLLFFSITYPFGVAVGSGTGDTASDGIIYYADAAANGQIIVQPVTSGTQAV